MFRLRNFNNKESNVGNKNMKVKHDMGNTPSRAILFVIYSIYIYEYEHDTYAHQAVSVWMWYRSPGDNLYAYVKLEWRIQEVFLNWRNRDVYAMCWEKK